MCQVLTLNITIVTHYIRNVVSMVCCNISTNEIHHTLLHITIVLEDLIQNSPFHVSAMHQRYILKDN